MSRLLVLLPTIWLIACPGGTDDTSEDSGVTGTDDTGGTDDDTSGTEDSDEDSDDEDSDEDSDDQDSDEDSDDTGDPLPYATVVGTVTVRPYRIDATGARVDVDWLEYNNSFPFGKIFIAAYDQATGSTVYYGQTSIQAPTIDPNPYTLTVNASLPELQVYAALDQANDRILSPLDPTGTWPDPVTVTADATTSGVDIIIDVDVTAGTSGGGGLGTPGTSVNVSGDVTITDPYNEGDVVAMVYDMGGIGPYVTDWLNPLPVPGDVVTPYSLSVGADTGNIQMLAAWDSNVNGLIDPVDKWGALSDGAGNITNPLNVGSVDIAGADMWIPLGGALSVVPFVAISGNLIPDTGDFTLYNHLYVAALKYRPGVDAPISIFDESYDFSEFDSAELAGAPSLPFTLVVPANAQTYVYAFADADGDGLVQEVGEPVGFLNGGNVMGTGLHAMPNQNITVFFGN